MKYALIVSILILSLSSCKNKAELEAERHTHVTNQLLTSSHSYTNNVMRVQDSIAYANGIDNWNLITQLKFTFNVKRNNNQTFSRSWVWHPKTQDVSMLTDQDTITFNRTALDSISTKADQAFINDKYWLHAPFNLVWDKGTTFTIFKNKIAPISNTTLNMLTITYGNDGGYTPGDAYDFYYNDKYIIQEWTFRKGNQKEPSLTTTWESYKTYNGIKFAEMHKDSTGEFQLFFTDIEVTTTETKD